MLGDPSTPSTPTPRIELASLEQVGVGQPFFATFLFLAPAFRGNRIHSIAILFFTIHAPFACVRPN